MKLEAGKKYVLASGQVVGPLFDELQEDGETYLYMSFDNVDNYMPIWKEDGKADFFVWSDNFPEHDIVKEFDESL